MKTLEPASRTAGAVRSDVGDAVSMTFTARVKRRFHASFVGRCLARYDRINGAQQGGFIALNALLGLVPIVLMTVALIRKAGIRSIRVDDALINKLDLTGPVVRSIHGAFSTSSGQARAITIVAVLGGATTLIGFCGSIWRVFNASLDRSRLPGIRASVRGLLWLIFTSAVIVVVQFAAAEGTRLSSGTIIHHSSKDIVRILGATFIWLMSPRILVERRIPYRKVLAGAVIGGLSSGVVIILSGLYVPGLLNSYAVPFGAFGVAIAIGFWLWTIAGVIVIGTVVMGELAGLDHTPAELVVADTT